MTRGISKVWGKIAASVIVDFDDVSEFECLRLVFDFFLTNWRSWHNYCVDQPSACGPMTTQRSDKLCDEATVASLHAVSRATIEFLRLSALTDCRNDINTP